MKKKILYLKMQYLLLITGNKMAYFIIDKESKEFGFFGSLPVMVEKFGLGKSSLEYHFSRKKETKFENEKYEIFKGELERGGSSK